MPSVKDSSTQAPFNHHNRAVPLSPGHSPLSTILLPPRPRPFARSTSSLPILPPLHPLHPLIPPFLLPPHLLIPPLLLPSDLLIPPLLLPPHLLRPRLLTFRLPFVLRLLVLVAHLEAFLRNNGGGCGRGRRGEEGCRARARAWTGEAAGTAGFEAGEAAEAGAEVGCGGEVGV